MKKVSVIVPAYNAEKHIANTIESLLKQTIDDFEIILVNDGSSDNTINILKKYEEKYDQIVVIDQKNSGPGGARNAGIKVASGEYIGFLDSDDTQDKTMYENMYNKAKEKNYDMVVCDTTTVYPNKKVLVESGITKSTNDKNQIKKDMIYSYAVIWNKIIKSEIVKKNLFSKKLWYEDVEFLYKLFPKVNSIGVINKSYCNYIQTEDSITYTYNHKIYDLITVLDQIIEYYKKENLYDEFKNELEYSYVRYLYGTFIRRIAKTKNKKEYKKAVELAIKKVRDNFPDYKKNIYLNKKGAKNIYLKHFNKLIAKIVFMFERNKMNYEIQNKIENILKEK